MLCGCILPVEYVVFVARQASGLTVRQTTTVWFATIDDLEEVQLDRCAVLQQQPAVIRSTTCFHWWPPADPQTTRTHTASVWDLGDSLSPPNCLCRQDKQISDRSISNDPTKAVF